MSSEIPIETKKWVPPPKIEQLFAATANNAMAAINAPTAGARYEQALPQGDAPIQLYSLATPNGIKVSIVLEELGLDYDAHFINISKGEQFSSGFVQVNPNSKIPALVDRSISPPVNLFESASIAIYLCEKEGRFLPKDPVLKSEAMNWIFWQMASQGPMCGNFGHFMVYAPDDKCETRDYGVARYGMEVQRLMSVLESRLASREWLVGEEYSLADMLCFPWARQILTGYKHSSGIDAKEFLSAEKYVNVVAWVERISSRPAVQRGITVCSGGVGKPWLVKKEEEEKK